MRFVELEEAKVLPGARLVVVGVVPSPWSQGALGLLDLKQVDYAAVRFQRGDEALRAWTGASNAPVLFVDGEPPRTGWADILAAVERMDGPPLVPAGAEARVRLMGLAHEILGEGGLGWSVRLLLTHAGLTTEGKRGWPVPLARYLGPKYGYAPERVEAARARAREALAALGRALEGGGGEYFFGAAPTALDVYAAAVMGIIAPMAEAECAMPVVIRRAFETLDDEVKAAVPEGLLAHRRRMFERHLVLPVRV
jgi:glutathione S-transferase